MRIPSRPFSRFLAVEDSPSGARRRAPFLLAVVGGLLLGLAYPGFSALEPVAGPLFAVPGAALLFLALCRSVGGKGAFLVGWTGGGVHFAVALHWIVYPFLVKAESHLWALPFAVALVPAGFGLFWALAFLAARRIVPGEGFALAVAFAAAMAAVEWLRGNILTGFPWAMPGHVWIGTEARILYPAFGANVATFLTFLAPALAVGGLPSARRTPRLSVRLISGIVLSALVAVTSFWAARSLTGSGPPMSDGAAGGPVLQLVQPGIPQREKWSRSFRSRNYRRLLALSEPVEGQEADLVIWPESAIPMILDRQRLEQDAYGLPVQLAERAGSGATFILGALTASPEGRFFNSLVILDGERGLSGIYDKHHLVPFGEFVPFSGLLSGLGLDAFTGGEFDRGPGPALMEVPGHPAFAVAICYEIIFPREMRHAAAGASWILQVTNDAWFGPAAGPKQHFALAQVRAAELGLPVVRVANTGITGIVDGTGLVIERLPTEEAGSLVRALPVGPPVRTPYSVRGDLVFFILLVVGFAVPWLVRRRQTG